jgi:hypothetical protein
MTPGKIISFFGLREGVSTSVKKRDSGFNGISFLLSGLFQSNNQGFYCIIMPESTWRHWPVMFLETSEAKKATALAISSVV